MIGSVNGTVLKSPEVVLDPSDGKALPRIPVNGTRRRCCFEIDSHCKDDLGGKFIFRTALTGLRRELS